MGIRKGDNVVIISGKDKGKKGKVILVEENDGKTRVTVEGANIIVKHKKARGPQKKSSREKKAGSIDVSNVQIICKCGKATRVAHKIDEKGKKNRVCAKCGTVLDKKFVKVKEKAVEAVEATAEKENEVDKKQPLQRREVKHTAESKIKSQTTAKSSTTHRQIGGA